MQQAHLYKTTDAGESWDVVATIRADDCLEEVPNSIACLSATWCVAPAGTNMTYVTTNSGMSWYVEHQTWVGAQAEDGGGVFECTGMQCYANLLGTIYTTTFQSNTSGV